MYMGFTTCQNYFNCEWHFCQYSKIKPRNITLLTNKLKMNRFVAYVDNIIGNVDCVPIIFRKPTCNLTD